MVRNRASPGEITVLPDGRFLTGTFQPGIVAIWSEAGEFERSFGEGPGEGPGEFRWVASLSSFEARLLSEESWQFEYTVRRVTDWFDEVPPADGPRPRLGSTVYDLAVGENGITSRWFRLADDALQSVVILEPVLVPVGR